MKWLMLTCALALTGCTTQLAKFTFYSPHRMTQMENQCVVDNSRRIRGIDHANIYLVFPSASLTYDAAVINAMNKEPDSVGLANVVITRNTFWFLFGYCEFVAEGNPVFLKEDN